MVVPAVILLLSFCVGTLQLSVQQLRVQDAAAVVARIEARGDGSASFSLEGLVPGASSSISRRGQLVCAQVSLPVAVAGITLAGARVSGASCAPSPSSGSGIDRRVDR